MGLFAERRVAKSYLQQEIGLMKRFTLSILVIAMLAMVVGVQAEPIYLGTVDKSEFIQQGQTGELDEIIDPEIIGGYLFECSISHQGLFYSAWLDNGQGVPFAINLACFSQQEGEPFELWRMEIDLDGRSVIPHDILVHNDQIFILAEVEDDGYYLSLIKVENQEVASIALTERDLSFRFHFSSNLVLGEDGTALAYWALRSDSFVTCMVIDLDAFVPVAHSIVLDITYLVVDDINSGCETRPSFVNGAWTFFANNVTRDCELKVVVWPSGLAEQTIIWDGMLVGASFIMEYPVGSFFRTLGRGYNDPGTWFIQDRTLSGNFLRQTEICGASEGLSPKYSQINNNIAFIQQSSVFEPDYFNYIIIINDQSQVSVVPLAFDHMHRLSSNIAWLEGERLANIRVVESAGGYEVDELVYVELSADGQVIRQMTLAPYLAPHTVYNEEYWCTSIIQPADDGGAWVLWEEPLSEEQYWFSKLYLEYVAPPAPNQPTPSVNTEQEQFSVHPNPFNASTTVTVNLPQAGKLKVNVFDVLGRQVAELANSQLEAGQHQFTLDGSNMSSGIYFVRANTMDGLHDVRKIILMK